MAQTDAGKRIIKRYSNRKLYDTKDSRYVTLQQIGEMVRQGEDVQIIDNKTKEDKTEVTLALIISEDLKNKPRSVSVGTLRNLIQERSEGVLSRLRETPLGRLIGKESSEDDEETTVDETADREQEEDDKKKGRVKEALDQVQQMLDEMRTIRELREEVDALKKRVTVLEKQVIEEKPAAKDE